MDFNPFSLIGDVLSVGGSIANNIMNLNAQKEANAQNEAFAREVNQINWDRQDTAIQRAVADAQSVGISPLSAIGQAAQSTSAMTANTVAPQFTLGQDAANLAALLTTQDTLSETKRKNLAEEKNAENSLAFEMDKFNKEVEIQNDRLQFEIDEAQKQHDEETARQLQSVSEFNQLLEEQKYEFDENAKIKSTEFENEYFYHQQEKSLEAYKNVCDQYGIAPKIKYCETEKDYNDALKTFYTSLSNAYNNVYYEYNKTEQGSLYVPKNVAGSNSSSSSNTIGGNVSVTGTGGGLNVSDSSSQSSSFNYSESMKAIFQSKTADLEFPVYYGSSRKSYSRSDRPNWDEGK